MSEPPAAAGRRPPELALRIVSALVLIALALAAVWYGGTVFAALCAAVAALILAEYLRIARARLPRAALPAAWVALGAVVAAWFLAGPLQSGVALAAGFVLLGLWELARQRSVWTALGLAYAALPFIALALLRATGPAGAHVMILMFLAVWATDIFAYFAGRTMGGPKLAPRVSPKKTWSGAIGGLAGAVVAMALGLVVLSLPLSFGALALALGLSIVSQVGDLLESALKRHFGVKDSGAIIPGHGGVLDRIDGLVLAGVAAWLCGAAIGGGAFVPGRASQVLLGAFVLP